jgi:Domain of unknown function (DUF5134)
VNVAGPSWATGLFAAVMIVTAVYCATRLAAAWRWRRPTEYDADGAHVFMGVAMAGMLVPRLDLFPHGGWEVIFGAAAAWFGWRAARAYVGQRGWLADRSGHRPAGRSAGGLHPAGRSADGPQPAHHPAGHYVHHLLACGAMLYMLLAVSAGPAGMSPASMARTAGLVATPPPLTLGLALVLFGGVLWAADRLVSPAPTAVAVAGVAAAGLAGNHVAGLGGGQVAGLGGGQVAGGESPTRAGRPMSPRLAASCEIVMGLTMGYMLITMV